ncbi:hypothetical protein P171DRAFT_406793 [Karstenula rhodostoma CBS 690.94]|uniref:Uncharacterized protein n=1 Tax=Karstenula rhodostoma CBS 690.94 TaxID=1392251 RepID=A0A9P4UGL8_9PLEO|nr:hypothetical protein P171DRAFT_406793 [Karstenula rhodostoma CBS 690.94]
MESAPLIRAQEHVRNASAATYAGHLARAGQEHELAAAAFHEGLSSTSNPESLRLIALLENNHRAHARRIKEPPRKTEKKKLEAANDEASDSATTSPPSAHPTARPASPPTSATSPTRALSRRRLPQSSIASNLAEARGIGPRRSTPSSASASVTNALASRNEHASTPVRDMLSRKAEAHQRNDTMSSSKHQDKAPVSGQSTPSATEDGFRRFYSAFGSVMSAITPPLAFTALPLTFSPAAPEPELPTKEAKPSKPLSKSRNHSPEAVRTVKSSEPDLAALISKPALRALREDGSAPLGPNESFYLVPTSGGTVSYANILQHPNAPHHPHPHPHHAAQNPHLASIDEADNESSGLRGSSHEEFVDARETVAPPSPTASRRPRSRGQPTPGAGAGVTALRSIPAGRGSGLKTLEEISLENETLKATVDKQAKRLSMWETTSQSSYNALAQSFRARKMPSDPSALAHALAMGANAVPPAQTDPQLAKRLAELEALVAERNAALDEKAKENERLERENRKNTEVLGRYRDQWEKLKAGARKRDMEKRAVRTKVVAEGEKPDKEKEEEEEDLEEEPGFGKA